MKKTTTINQVEGAYLYELDRHDDDRGFFEELYGPIKYFGFNVEQVNRSSSHRYVLRGLHVVPFAKLCMCVNGKIFDVVADVRPDSPTYLGWYGTWLKPATPTQLFVPAGCAHGFFSAEEDSILVYMQNGTYDPENEREVNCFDPKLGIDWPHSSKYIISDKDRDAPMLED